MVLVPDVEADRSGPTPFMEDRDGKAVISHLDSSMRLAVILCVMVPRVVATAALAWTGGKLFMLTHNMAKLLIPLLSLTYLCTVPALLFSGFASFKFKEKVVNTSYLYQNGLCYA